MHVQGQTNDVKAYNKLTYVEDHEKSMHLDRGGWIGLIKKFIHLTICVYTNKSILSFIKGDWTKRFKCDDVYKLTQQGRIYDFQIKKIV